MWKILLFLAATIGLGAHFALAKGSDVLPPYNVAAIREMQPEVPPRAQFSCPEPPAAIQDLLFRGIYKDKHSSEIDDSAKEEYGSDMLPIKKFETGLIRLANGYVFSHPADERKAVCALSWLLSWAEQKALLGETNPMGESVQKWTLATIASVYLQIKDSPLLEKRGKNKVEAWLQELGETVIAHYSTQLHRSSRNNNHVFWAAWSVAITAAAINEPDMLEWAINKARTGLRNIQEDGTMELELYRRSRAAQYHLFATTPLVMLAEIAAANGIDLYSYSNGALHRLIKLDMEIFKNPDVVAKKAKAKQHTDHLNSPGLSAWMPAYYNRFSDPDIAAYMETVPDLQMRRAGGNMRLLYAPLPQPLASTKPK